VNRGVDRADRFGGQPNGTFAGLAAPGDDSIGEQIPYDQSLDFGQKEPGRHQMDQSQDHLFRVDLQPSNAFDEGSLRRNEVLDVGPRNIEVGRHFADCRSVDVRCGIAFASSRSAALSKLTKPIKKPKATWVEPTFFADVEYRDISSEGLLRQSSFKGLKRK
jgi:hypothetical protein